MPTLQSSLVIPEAAVSPPPAFADAELERIQRLPFFELQQADVRHGRLVVIGKLFRERQHGGREKLTVRVVYPPDSPANPPDVFDHEKLLRPGCLHLFPDHRLCLTFPAAREFSIGSDLLGMEVFESSLNWMIKRFFAERNRGTWPEESDHNYALPFARIAREQAEQLGHIFTVWVEFALKKKKTPNPNGACLCLSGKPFRVCHSEVLSLVASALQANTKEDAF